MSKAPQDRPSRGGARHGDGVARDVLRYWLALLTYEEALSARPRARRPTGVVLEAINVREPVAGQDYAKLPFTGAEAFLVDGRGSVDVELCPEWFAFFEDWLAARYRRGGEDELEQLVFFPTVHLPRDELAGLLRLPVKTQWRMGDRAFVVPDYAQRRRGEWPAPPTRAMLNAAAREVEQGFPFFVDTKLLQETLRVDPERIDQFVSDTLDDELTRNPRAAIEALADLIEQQGLLEDRSPRRSRPPKPKPASASPSDVLARLSSVVAQRLAELDSRARVYGVALVVNHFRARATWHLQRDIGNALAILEEDGLAQDSPLSAYLTGAGSRGRQATCWGRWRKAGLTESQRAACELALGSTLCAVQGPPGTGKTTLILNLLAHTLVCKVTALARSGGMGRGITLVTSTNNRAVDNVVHPLSRDLDDDQLPLSLRVGSRQVSEKVTLVELERVRRWLQARPAPEGDSRRRLQTELERFRGLRAGLERQLTGIEAYRESVERSRTIEAQLEELRAELAEGSASTPLRRALLALTVPNSSVTSAEPPNVDGQASAVDALLERSGAQRERIRAALDAVCGRLVALSRLAEGSGRSALTSVRKHYKRTKNRQLADLNAALGFDVAPLLPPTPEPNDPDEALAAWEEAAEAELLRLGEIARAFSTEDRRRRDEARLAQLERELDAARARTAGPPPEPPRAALDQDHLELFESAVRVREAWACVHSAEILAAIDDAVRSIEANRSLRALFEARAGAARWLLELFPTFGCTLLSIGNVFPPSQRVPMVVIDEAGQCHPAYAVAALLRAESALVIGDVYQLEPVVGLSADAERRILRGLELKSAAEKLEPYRSHDAAGTSAQSLADRAVTRRPTLVDHFRCQPEIAAICEALCGYGLIAHTPWRTRADSAPFLASPVLHVPVDGCQERFAGSWINEAELSAALELIERLLAAHIPPSDLGVITPYRGQLERLWRALRTLGVPLERASTDSSELEQGELFAGRDAGLAVGTVHRFQGGERSVMLLTTTVTERRSLGFLNDRVNLVNVAASRAREHLITLGHSAALRAGRHTRHLVERALRLDWPPDGGA